MTRYHHVRSRRPPPRSRNPRSKRPLIVLTYRNNHLETIHSSTPSVQFVRLDMTPPQNPDPEDGEFPVPSTARQLTIPSLSELPHDLHRAAQRAFRRS